MSDPTPEQIVASVTPESVYGELGEHGAAACVINTRINPHPQTEPGKMIAWKLFQCLELLEETGKVSFRVDNGVKIWYRVEE